jgi:hypothetical protein
MMRIHLVIGVCIGAIFSGIGSAQPGWIWENPMPQGNTLRAVVYGADKFVAVGDFGALVSSPDGASWRRHTPPTTLTLNAITHGAHQFIAVGDSGVILSSPDALTWTKRASGTLKKLRSVAFGGDRFVAVGEQGTILSSIDGAQWTDRSKGLPSQSSLLSITYGNGLFVAVGYTLNVYVSTDALAWQDKYGGHNYQELNAVTYSNNRFIAVGSRTLSSPDGLTWTNSDGADQNLFSLAYGNNTFVAAGNVGMINTAPDGIDWTLRYYRDQTDFFFGLAFGAGTFVAVGYKGMILRSTDGATWTTCHSGPTNHLNCIIHDNNRFVAVGDHGTILSSSDGSAWEGFYPDSFSLRHLTYALDLFVAVGDSGSIVTSPDGKAWAKQASGTGKSLRNIAFGNGQFAAVGAEGTIVTSSDAVAWTVHSSGTDAPLNEVAFGGNRFVVVGSNATILSSPDGADWTQRSDSAAGGLNSIFSVIYGNGVFVAVGDNSFHSSDGVNWSPLGLGGATLFKVTFTGNAFVALGVQGGIFVSPNGLNWMKKNVISPIEETTEDAAFGDTRFVVGGSRGFITGAPEDSFWTLRSGQNVPIQSIAYGKGRFVAVGWNGAILACDEDKLGARMQAPPKTAPSRLRVTGNHGNLFVHLPDGIDPRGLSLEVISLSGKIVYKTPLQSHGRMMVPPAGALAKGTYLLNISDHGSRILCTKFNAF